jgi:hypothetical protein
MGKCNLCVNEITQISRRMPIANGAMHEHFLARPSILNGSYWIMEIVHPRELPNAPCAAARSKMGLRRGDEGPLQMPTNETAN